MKNKYLFFVFLAIAFNINSFSQTTYIPDDVFEQTLIDLGFDSGPLDNYIKTANLDKITYLDLSNKKIKKLTGIEDFLHLQILIYDASLLNILKNTKTSTFTKLENKNSTFNILDISRNGSQLTSSNIGFSLYRNRN